MQELPQNKRRNGYVYTLVKRTKKAALYEQFCPIAKKIIGYEVFKIKIVKSCNLKNLNNKAYTYPSREKFPGNEDFGHIAWTYSSLEKATKKFEELK